ncbi:MAG: hypothetical protein ACRC5T_10275 [Cetobacterium sp.]
MKKKILFICYDFFGYEKKIISLMESYLEYEVVHINPENYRYNYKNIIEKAYNSLILKPFFKVDLKEIKFTEKIIKDIKKKEGYDYIFCIRPDKTNHELMEYLKKMKIPMIIHHWDSISFIKEQEDYLKYFDKKLSFDKEECKKYGMIFNPNFYIDDFIVKNNEIKYDLFTVMSYDKRYILLEKIAKHLKKIGIKYKIIVVTDKNIKSSILSIQKNRLSLEETYKYISESKVVLEIGHTENNNSQGGLSFRAADGIGNRKKIITNYKIIKKYDFYNKNNINLISETNYKIEKDFFKQEYKEISKQLHEKYSDKNWIKKIFGGF